VDGTRGIPRQRGFWLRCFLGTATVLAAAWLLPCEVSDAQPDVPRPIHLVHLKGVVVNPKGEPVQNADVSLLRGDRVAYSTHTDGAGQFVFEHVDGHFQFRVKTTNYSVAARDVVVEFEISALRRNTLYVILGPGACSDDCSSVFTKKSQFDQTIRRNTKHSY
jgi:hypothetical protein